MRIGVIHLCAAAILLVCTGNVVAKEAPDHICFRRIDTDKDGKVTFQEFAVHYGKDEAMFKAGDANGDGWLTHDEYHDFLDQGASD